MIIIESVEIAPNPVNTSQAYVIKVKAEYIPPTFSYNLSNQEYSGYNEGVWEGE